MILESKNSQRSFHYLKMVELGEEFFNYNPKRHNEAIKNIKDAVRFLRFKLPSELKEDVLRCSSAPVFWIIDSPFLKSLETHIKKYTNTNIDNFNLAKELYTKWVINKNFEEKKYIAASAAKLIEKNSKDTCFLMQIYLGVILAYEQSIYNPEKAEKIYVEAIHRLSFEKLAPETINEITYYIHIFRGFNFLIQDQYDELKGVFQAAQEIHPNSFTVKLYLKICEITLGTTHSIRGTIEEILELDYRRIDYAVSKNDFDLLEHFINNNITSTIFGVGGIGSIYEEFESILEGQVVKAGEVFNHLSEKLKRIKNYPDQSVLKVKDRNIIAFFDKTFETFLTTRNYLFSYSLDKFERKLDNLIDDVVYNIKDSFKIDIDEKIKTYTLGIKDHEEQIIHLKEELLLFNDRLKNEEVIALEKFEEKLEEEIENLENRIENLQNLKDLNPKLSFQNTMLSGIVISILVSVLGGVAGYSNTFSSNITDFSKVISIVVLSGIKWGVVGVIITFVFSLLMAGSVILEKSNQRMKLIKKISDMKRFKETEINKIKEYFKLKEKSLEKDYEDKIKTVEETLKNYIDEKEEKEQKLYAEVEESVKYEVEKFLEFIKLTK